MRSEVKRWGNSAAVRLPKAVLHRAGLTIDDVIEVEVDDGVIMIKRSDTAHADELGVVLPSELGD